NINAQINIQNQKYARLSAEDETETESGNASTAKKANNKYTTQPYRLAAQMFPGASHLSW
ncbi:hypothetical protein ACSLO9_34925, partial [Escherichia coli]